MNTFGNQRGLTMWGWLVVGSMAGVLFLAALKLVPVYMEYYNALGIIEQVVNDPELRNASKDKIQMGINRRLGLADLRNIRSSDYTLTKIQGRNAYTLELYYEVRTPLFGNLSMVAEFEHTEEVGE